MKVPAYAKTVVSVVIVVAMALKGYLTDDTFTVQEMIDTGLALLGALGVWGIPNTIGGVNVNVLAKKQLQK
jgi:hypothetical protein